DVQLVRLEIETFQCDYSIYGRAQVENAGTLPLSSFTVQVQLEDGTTWETDWSGDLLTGERTWVELGPFQTDLGTHQLQVEVGLPNMMDDERPLNNRLLQEVEVDDRQFLDAFLAQGPDMFYCDGGEALLKVNYDGGGTIEVNWYDAAIGGDLLGTGQAFSLGGLTETTTVYAEATYHEQVGMANPFLGEFGFDADNQERGLVFDALKPFYLRRVKLFTEETGAVIIKLADNQGETIAQKVVVLGQVGENLVNIDLLVPQGNDVELQVQAGIPLAYSSSGMTFPYIIEDVVRIEKSNFPPGSSGLGRYNYFYDWEIEYDEFCARAVVEIPYLDTGLLPVAGFSASNTPLDLDAGAGNVVFTDASQNATNWFWDFGDGNTGLGQNPTHIYTTPGNYAVTLIITNAFGCSDTVINPQHVTIFTAPTASFTVSDSFFCAPQSVLFSGTSTPGSNPIATYFYDFGNGATSNNINSTQFFNTPG
ncbi:MAG: PKD domain-containing protein, partial [Phaeodactylibacter sp.]|nr:PKD domain-containing protein [Phaeodactylibacter sp.]